MQRGDLAFGRGYASCGRSAAMWSRGCGIGSGILRQVVDAAKERPRGITVLTPAWGEGGPRPRRHRGAAPSRDVRRRYMHARGTNRRRDGTSSRTNGKGNAAAALALDRATH